MVGTSEAKQPYADYTAGERWQLSGVSSQYKPIQLKTGG